jgi:hypothetical protein
MNTARRAALIADDTVKVVHENVILNWTFPHPLMKREASRGRNFTHLFFRSSKTHNMAAHCASLLGEHLEYRLLGGQKKSYFRKTNCEKKSLNFRENEQLLYKNHTLSVSFSFVLLTLL